MPYASRDEMTGAVRSVVTAKLSAQEVSSESGPSHPRAPPQPRPVNGHSNEDDSESWLDSQPAQRAHVNGVAEGSMDSGDTGSSISASETVAESSHGSTSETAATSNTGANDSETSESGADEDAIPLLNGASSIPQTSIPDSSPEKDKDKEKEDARWEITPSELDARMMLAHSPPLDILVRTSGVSRLSDFMLWQVSFVSSSSDLNPSLIWKTLLTNLSGFLPFLDRPFFLFPRLLRFPLKPVQRVNNTPIRRCLLALVRSTRTRAHLVDLSTCQMGRCCSCLVGAQRGGCVPRCVGRSAMNDERGALSSAEQR